MNRVLAVACVVATWLSTSGATAQGRRVVLVDLGPQLERATTMALAPWELDVTSVAAAEPGATMPGSADLGRRIALERDALAVVWLSSADEGFALWVYDRRDDRVVARGLPSGPPFDGPTAAEIALVIKTLLRTVPTVSPTAEPATNVEEPPAEPAEPLPPPELGDRWSFLMAAGARAFATSPSDVEGRVDLGLTFWPSLLEHHLGFTLLASGGPGVAQESVALRTRWIATELLLAVRGRLPVGDVLDLGLMLGVGARLSTLDGEASGRDVPVEQRRLDPHSSAGLEIGARAAPWLRFAFRVSTQFPWRVQKYLVDGLNALEVSPLSVGASLGAELGF